MYCSVYSKGHHSATVTSYENYHHYIDSPAIVLDVSSDVLADLTQKRVLNQGNNSSAIQYSRNIIQQNLVMLSGSIEMIL